MASKAIQINPPLQNTSVTLQIPDNLASCPICLDEYPSHTIIALNSCSHSFCTNCLKEYLNIRIQNIQVLKIPCPQSGCQTTFTDHILRRILTPDQYNRYQELALKKLANRDLNNKFCPKAGCSKSLKIFTNTDSTVCSCGTRVCNTCNNFWHEGKSCIEAMDPEFEYYSKENDIRFCILCKTVIKREEGCTHITCPVCDYEWCWICGREFAITHPCPGYWSPAPPSMISSSHTNTPNSYSNNPKIKTIWRASSIKKKVLLVIAGTLGFPLILIVVLLIWPVYIFYDVEKDLSLKKPGKAVCAVLTSMLIGFFCLPATLLYVYMAVLFGIILGPYLLVKRLMRSSRIDKEENKAGKRWMTGDASKFVYTNKSKLEGQRRPVLGLEEQQGIELIVINNNVEQATGSQGRQEVLVINEDSTRSERESRTSMTEKIKTNSKITNRRLMSEIKEESGDSGEVQREVTEQEIKLKISSRRHSLGVIQMEKDSNVQISFV